MSEAPAAGLTARLLAGVDGPPTLDAHIALFGPMPSRIDLIAAAQRAGLRGRGGAGFPTARKLAAVRAQGGRPAVVANGAEGEPASAKDRSLLRVAPHLVLDGAVAAARAVGARDVIVAVSRPAPELVAAVAERRRESVRVDVRRVPNRFVAGEETALLSALEGKPAKPRLKPPYPVERGYRRQPTLVQNVETLAHLALIGRFGPGWFGSGTALITLGGAVARPGVHEIPMGVTIADAVEMCGGVRGEVAAYLTGGFFGSWFAAEQAGAVALTAERLGAGALVALPASTCPVAEVARVVDYLAGETAAQCGPCLYGLRAIADALLASSRTDRRRDLERWTAMVAGRGACRHPDGVARFVDSARRVFAADFARHARGRGCGRRLQSVLPVGGSAR